MSRRQQETSHLGFCGLLSLGAILCRLGAVVGVLISLVGFATLNDNLSLGLTQLSIGAGCLFQSLVSLGVLQSLLWIVDRLLSISLDDARDVDETPPPIDFEEFDGVKNKPVLKRRRV